MPSASAATEPASPIKLPGKDASVDELLAFVLKCNTDIPRVLSRAKSVTSIMRKRADELSAAAASATRIIQSKLSDPDCTIVSGSVHDAASDIRDVVREEIAKLREELVRRPAAAAAASEAPVSYAAAAAKRTKVKTPVSRPAIVLKPAADDVKSSKDVLNVWKKSVSFKDATFAPARVQSVSNGCVRVEFDDVHQRDATLTKLQSVTSVSAEAARRARPLLIIKGISKDVRSEDVVGLVRQQNPSVQPSSDDDLRVRFVRRNRKDELFNLVVEASPVVRVQLLELGRLNIDHQRVHVSDFSSLVQCYKCLGFGHTRNKCASEEQRCSHCAASGHYFASCPDKADESKLKCFNCNKSGRASDCKHSATSAKHCPQIRTMQKRIASRTDYGC